MRGTFIFSGKSCHFSSINSPSTEHIFILYKTLLHELYLLKCIPRHRDRYLWREAESPQHFQQRVIWFWVLLCTLLGPSLYSFRSSDWRRIHCLSRVPWILSLTCNPSDSKVSQNTLSVNLNNRTNSQDVLNSSCINEIISENAIPWSCLCTPV